jgi:hypothetical protein
MRPRPCLDASSLWVSTPDRRMSIEEFSNQANIVAKAAIAVARTHRIAGIR